jgi:glycosyltransferase involved in cell wall biosynthesis
MEVILDIMSLGMSYRKVNGEIYFRERTGIFRVADELARGLVKSPDIEVDFISPHYPSQSSQYIKDENFSKKSIAFPTIKHRAINKIKSITGNNKALNSILPSTSITSLVSKADIYHSPFFPILEEVSESQTIKSFLTVHDLIPILYPEYFENERNPLVKIAIQSNQKDGYYFCVSNSTKNDLCNYFSISPDRVFVTPLAASKARFFKCVNTTEIETVKAKYQLRDKQYFLSLSTLEPRKNIDHIIRCFIKLIQEEHLNDVYLVLAGTKGWDFDKIFNEIENASALKERIILTGYVADEDLAFLYSGALAFIYTSFYEGFGLPPLEAMQCGTPVITSNTSSLPEVVGDAGILVDPRDADTLCSAMLNIYSNTELREKMSNDSTAQAEKFSWDNFIQSNLYGYQKALANG